MGNPSWEVQYHNKVNVDFCLPYFSATKIVTWKCHVNESTNVRYNMILGRDLITALGLNLKFSDHFIIIEEGLYEECSTPMVDVRNYDFIFITYKPLNRKNPL